MQLILVKLVTKQILQGHHEAQMEDLFLLMGGISI